MKGPSRSSRPASPRPRRTIEPRRYRTAAAPFSARNGRADRGKLASPKMDVTRQILLVRVGQAAGSRVTR